MNDEEKSCSCTTDKMCEKCLKSLKDKGIPQRTLDWLQLSKDERIASVMF